MGIDAVSGIKTAQKMVDGLRLAPKIGNKLIGDASAIQLAGIARLTAKNLDCQKFYRSSEFQSGKNFIEFINGFLRKINPEGMTQDGRFTEKLRNALNETGYTLKDFAKFVNTAFKFEQIISGQNPIANIFSRFCKTHNIRSMEDLMKTCATSQKKGGSTKVLVDNICKRMGISIEEAIKHLQETINVENAVINGLKK